MLIDDTDKKIIRQLQGDIPLTARPFAALADDLGIPEEEYLDRINKLKSNRVMRRLAGILRQKESGYTINAMLVWQQDEATADQVGNILAELESISHLYLRATDEDWPFNMYAMVHARNENELDRIYHQVMDLTGNKTINIVKSVREYKKMSMQYDF